MSKEKNKQRKHTSKNTKPKNVYAKDEDRDRHLQAPTEANRDEHINFTALERGEQDPADEGKDKNDIVESNTKPENVYAKDEDRDRHLQAPTEANRDKHINFLAEERGEEDPADEEEK
jgi:hypothetical protein